MYGALASSMTLDCEWFSSMITKMCFGVGAILTGGAGFVTTMCFFGLWCFGGFFAAAPPWTASNETTAASSAKSANLRCDM